MTTKLAVYNGALQHLDTEALASLSEEGKKRRALDTAYDGIVEWCLEQGNWNFATRSAEVEASPSLDTTFGYAYVFEKPDDWIRTAALTHDEYGRSPVLDYEDRTDYWLADVTPIYTWWVSNDADYGLDLGRWPETFTTFVEYALAHKTCGVITGSKSDKDTLYKKMIRAKRDALNKDALAQPVTKFPPTGRLVATRTGNGLGSREGRFRAG